jgi:hypothetical protein
MASRHERQRANCRLARGRGGVIGEESPISGKHGTLIDYNADMCSFEGCTRKSYIRGLCGGHHQQAKRGRPLTPLPPYKPRNRVSGTLAERLAAKSQRNESGCLIWTGALKANGYGKLVFEGKNLHAHRAAYELAKGPIPEGLTLDHTCHTNDSKCPGGDTCPHRACIDPDHLEPVTRAENVKLGATKTHCKRGHELAGENVRLKQKGKYLVRDCRACDRETKRERYRTTNQLPPERYRVP